MMSINKPSLIQSSNCRFCTNFTQKLEDEKLSPIVSLLHNIAMYKGSLSKIHPNYNITLQDLETPFTPEDLYTYTVDIPLTGQFGLTMINDDDFGIPLIIQMHQDSPFKLHCKKSYHNMSWVVRVHNNKPITVQQMIEYLNFMQQEQITKIKVTLSHKIKTNSTRYQEYRSFFDNIRPIAHQAYSPRIIPDVRYAIQVPTKPTCPKTMKDLQDYPLREYFIYAIYEQYTKYHEGGLASIPEPKKNIPSSATVLKAIPTFKVKPTEVKNVYDLVFCLCAHGGYQVPGQDFDQTHAPVASPTSLRIFLALSAALNLSITASDVSNAFQSTNRFDKDRKPLYLSCPPYYMS